MRRKFWMDFNEHSALVGQHAFLSASYHHWVNYDDQKLVARWNTVKSAVRGTQLHEFAHSAIKLGIKQSRAKKTLYMYVNDAIGYKMSCEQVLYYSDNAFGTADTISFRRGVLRIHDLKTGITKTSFRQLEIYAAYFCLEYGVNPFDIRMEFRIYQNDEVRIQEGDPEVISYIMDKTIDFDIRVEQLKIEEGRT
jgi:hypothetical protein